MEEFDLIQWELDGLFKQDKYGVSEGQTLLVSENTTLRPSREFMRINNEIKDNVLWRSAFKRIKIIT